MNVCLFSLDSLQVRYMYVQNMCESFIMKGLNGRQIAYETQLPW